MHTTPHSPDAPRLLSRRQALAALALPVTLPLAGCWDTFGLLNPCANRGDPGHRIDPAISAFVWAGLDARNVLDMHVHLSGEGTAPGDPWVNPAMRTLAHPFSYTHFALMANAACLGNDPANWSRRYVSRLVALADEFRPGARFLLLALDGYHGADGRLDRARTVFMVPDEYAARVARGNPGRFLWAASVHPYREDALERLRSAAENGARAVKWIPYFMGIDPANPRCRPFYRQIARLGLPLITHGGWEHELMEDGQQDLGNPLRLRAALEEGATVIMAHCAIQGDFADLDRPMSRTPKPSFELFARLLDAPEYRSRLYGDLSAVVQGGRQPGALARLLSTFEWHPRLLNGSDYPGPGVVAVMGMKDLVEEGVLAAKDAERIWHIQKH
ncbi:MAG TPA: amidohydrolase family protein, partial [Usitatibacteraceae bacterium]|nr:amidohydrolase family protein [Usitatibacteraceae bacterium]